MVTISGGDKAERFLRDFIRRVGKSATLKVGVLAGATYPDGTPVAMVAAAQEFGTQNIPARSFMRRTVREKSDAWPEALAKCMEATNDDPAASLALMGEGIKGQIQETITKITEPKLSPLTLLARKHRSKNPDEKFTAATLGVLADQLKKGPPDLSGVSTKPLVDTGTLLNSIDYEVGSGDE